MAEAAESLPPIGEEQKPVGPRYVVKSSRHVIFRPNGAAPHRPAGFGAFQSSVKREAFPVPASSRPPAFNPKVARRGLFAKEWVGDRSAVLNTIAAKAQSLEQRVELVSQYTQSGDLKPINSLDNLVGMPYTAYGFQALSHKQEKPVARVAQQGFRDPFVTPQQLYATAFSTAKLQPSRPASTLMSVRSAYERMTSSPQPAKELMMNSLPSVPKGGKQGPQMFRPVYSSWNNQAGRPHSSLEVYSDFWARSSTPVSIPQSPVPVPGSSSKARRPLPVAPPGRSPATPNTTVPGEPTFVSQLVAGGVSRLDGHLRDTVSEIDGTFMRIHELIRSHEVTDQENSAATTIQKVFRGWSARQRYSQAMWAVRAWYRENLAMPRQRFLDWTRRREAQEEYIDIVKQCQSKDLLRVAFRAWTFNLDTGRKIQKAKDERAAVFYHQLLIMRVREFIRKWLAVSLGEHSRKASLVRRKMRNQAARARLVGMAEEMGWTGNITDDMIKRELENEAVASMTHKIRLRLYRVIMMAWSKYSQFRRIAKGKHLQSDRKHSQFVVNKAWQAWRGTVVDKMKKWQEQGRDFNRHKLWGVARREGRMSIQRWALRYWLRRVKLTGRLSVHAKMMMSRTQAAFFRAYREQVQIQRELRAMAMQQWQIVSRDTIGYPFRRWIKFTSQQKAIKQERMKTAGAMLYRYRRRLILRCFSALKINLEQSRLVIELPRMAAESSNANDPKSPASNNNLSRSLRPTTSTERLDAELDELIGGPRDRKNESSFRKATHRRTESSLNSSNRRGVLFQLDSSKNSSLSGHAYESAREDHDGFIGNLEKNLDTVLSATMLDPTMEAHRLRAFLENLGSVISESRSSALEIDVPSGFPNASPDATLSTPSSRSRRLNSTKNSQTLGRYGEAGEFQGGRSKSPRSRPSSRATSSKSKPGKNKSFRSGNKAPAQRSMSKHQLAFFSAFGGPDDAAE